MTLYPPKLLLAIGARRALPALLTALLALPQVSHADVYKCRLPGGKTEISNTPCSTPAATLGVRPDDTVPEASREQAERDVERMRHYVEKREAAQRAEEEATSRQQAEARDAYARQAVSRAANMDDCLAELNLQPLEPRRRSELEAVCRAKPRTMPTATPVVVTRHIVSGNGVSSCIQNVLHLQLAPAEQNRRIQICQGQTPTAVSTTPATAAGKPAGSRNCPRGDLYCAR